jgi:hypothetical protein
MYLTGIEPSTLWIMGSSLNHRATTVDADDRHCVLLQYIIDAGATEATMGAGAAAVSNRYPSYPILSFISYFIPVQYWSGPAGRRRLGGP